MRLSATDAWHKAESVMGHIQHLSLESLVKIDHFKRSHQKWTTGAQNELSNTLSTRMLMLVFGITGLTLGVAERRDRAPGEQECVMLSNEHEQLCFVCYRVVDMPTPRVPSVQWPCAGCDAPIWVPKKSPVAPPKICIRCTDPDVPVS